MTGINWKVIVASPDADDETSAVITQALRNLVALYLDVLDSKPLTLIPHEGLGDNVLIIVPSICTDAIKSLFRDLINSAYGNKARKSTLKQLTRHRYLFVACGQSSLMFEGLRRTFAPLELCKTEECHNLLPAITEILKLAPASLTVQSLRNAIELTCFPSGAEEMQEVYFRDSLPIHYLLGLVMEAYGTEPVSREETYPALRMLLGAFAAGDIEVETVTQSLKTLGLHSDELNELLAHIEGYIRISQGRRIGISTL